MYKKVKSECFAVSLIKENNSYGFYDLYSGIFVTVSEEERNDIIHEITPDFLQKYNVEHIVPSSVYNQKWEIYSDLHNIVPSVKIINDYRGNIPIVTIPKDGKDIVTICQKNKKYETIYQGEDPSCVQISIGVPEGTKILKNSLHEPETYKVKGCVNECYFEPADTKFRGMIARSILYFNSRYRSFLSEQNKLKYLSLKILSIMRNWNEKYPPTPYEISRNLEIYKKKGTINEFFVEALKNLNLSKSKKDLVEFSPKKIILSLPIDFFKK